MPKGLFAKQDSAGVMLSRDSPDGAWLDGHLACPAGEGYGLVVRGDERAQAFELRGKNEAVPVGKPLLVPANADWHRAEMRLVGAFAERVVVGDLLTGEVHTLQLHEGRPVRRRRRSRHLPR